MPLTEKLFGAHQGRSRSGRGQGSVSFRPSATGPHAPLSSAERDEIATIAKDKPNIDLEVNFNYDSATISKDPLSSVQALGHALTNAELKGSTFIIMGYTRCSRRDGHFDRTCPAPRDSIKRHLTDKFGITSTDLVTIRIRRDQAQGPQPPQRRS